MLPCIAGICFYYLDQLRIMYQLLQSKWIVLLSGYLIEDRPQHFIINYPYGIKWYKMLIPKNSKRLISVISPTGENIKHSLKEYLGPYDNFGNVRGITPALLGYNSLTFKDVLNTEQTFSIDEQISL